MFENKECVMVMGKRLENVGRCCCCSVVAWNLPLLSQSIVKASWRHKEEGDGSEGTGHFNKSPSLFVLFY
eukprot:scaffold42704_cov206-Amphora_coffeaeformis.AAC.1